MAIQRRQPIRIYADTSVLGGCFDDEFAEHSKRLIDQARSGNITLLFSEFVLTEVRRGPKHVQELLTSLPARCVEDIATDNRLIG